MFFDPFERIEKLRKHLKKLFRDTEVGIFTFAPMSGYKDGNNIVYEFELPGFSKQDIKLKVDNGFIDLKAEKKIDK
jgi:HSP20 family molecular chaperone IbpA